MNQWNELSLNYRCHLNDVTYWCHQNFDLLSCYVTPVCFGISYDTIYLWSKMFLHQTPPCIYKHNLSIAHSQSVFVCMCNIVQWVTIVMILACDGLQEWTRNGVWIWFTKSQKSCVLWIDVNRPCLSQVLRSTSFYSAFHSLLFSYSECACSRSKFKKF